MGKSKAKKAQRYPTPSDTYLIVSDPWGGVPLRNPDFFNNITAWFQIMLKSVYPGIRPSAIYYQWTNMNIVVELPDHIDATPFLGAHYWKDILDIPYDPELAEKVSYVYEFDYKNHHIPPAAGGWTPGYARYVNICSDFVIRDPYPPSRRAKNSPLAFAKKLPPGKLLLPGQEDLPLLPLFPPEISELQRLEDNGESGSGLGGPSNGPIKGRGVRSLVGNNEREMTDSVESSTRDLRRSEAMEKCSSTTESNPDGFSSRPFEDLFQAAEHFLRDIIPDSNPRSFASTRDISEEEDRTSLRHPSSKTTISTMTGDRPLPSTISTDTEIERESFDYDYSVSDSNAGYVPSAELQAAFASLNRLSHEEEDIKPQIKEEDIEPRIKEEDIEPQIKEQYGYTPSNDLLSAFASLPSDMVDLSSTTVNMKRDEIRVKIEPRNDDDNVSHLASTGYIQIKREPESPDHGLLVKKIKLEQ